MVDAQNHAQRTDVAMGQQFGSDWLVEKGLKVGDTVVIDGVQKLKPGMSVEVQFAPAATAEPKARHDS